MARLSLLLDTDKLDRDNHLDIQIGMDRSPHFDDKFESIE